MPAKSKKWARSSPATRTHQHHRAYIDPWPGSRMFANLRTVSRGRERWNKQVGGQSGEVADVNNVAGMPVNIPGRCNTIDIAHVANSVIVNITIGNDYAIGITVDTDSSGEICGVAVKDTILNKYELAV